MNGSEIISGQTYHEIFTKGFNEGIDFSIVLLEQTINKLKEEKQQ